MCTISSFFIISMLSLNMFCFGQPFSMAVCAVINIGFFFYLHTLLDLLMGIWSTCSFCFFLFCTSFFNTLNLLVSIQVNMWRGSCAVMPSCPCRPFVRCLAQRTVPWAPGPHGLCAPTPALEKTQMASRPELARSSPITREKVTKQCRIHW